MRPIARRDGWASVTTVLASRGYPDHPEKGAAITIPAALPTGVTVFHAGTTRDADGVLRVSGGRVLNVTAVAPTFAEAQRLSREGAEAIEFDGKVFRRDIGWREARGEVHASGRAGEPRARAVERASWADGCSTRSISIRHPGAASDLLPRVFDDRGGDPSLRSG